MREVFGAPSEDTAARLLALEPELVPHPVNCPEEKE